MRKHVFLELVHELRNSGLQDSKYITLEVQTAIFLYTCVTGLKSRHVAERFQHSHTTITKYIPTIVCFRSCMIDSGKSDISKEFFLLCHQHPSTKSMCFYQRKTPLSHVKSARTRNSFHTLQEHLGQWMALTSTVVHQ